MRVTFCRIYKKKFWNLNSISENEIFIKKFPKYKNHFHKFPTPWTPHKVRSISFIYKSINSLFKYLNFIFSKHLCRRINFRNDLYLAPTMTEIVSIKEKKYSAFLSKRLTSPSVKLFKYS